MVKLEKQIWLRDGIFWDPEPPLLEEPQANVSTQYLRIYKNLLDGKNENPGESSRFCT